MVARIEGRATMTVGAIRQAPHHPVDMRRWPGMAPPKPAPVRAALARVFLRRVATRTGIRVDMEDGSHFGPVDGPIMAVRDPEHSSRGWV